MPDRLCCNGFTFQHGMGCKRTQPAIACFDNIKKKNLKNSFQGETKTMQWSCTGTLCRSSHAWRNWGFQEMIETFYHLEETKPTPPKKHHHTDKNPHQSYSVKEKTDSNSWTCSFLIFEVIWRLTSRYNAGLNTDFFQTVLLSSPFAVPPPTSAKATSKHPLTDVKQF